MTEAPPLKVLVHVVTQCPRCKVETTLQVNKPGLERWQKGALIQDCELGLGPDDLEKMISGYCAPCWDIEYQEDIALVDPDPVDEPAF